MIPGGGSGMMSPGDYAMFQCDRCSGEFSVFAKPGQCPLCAQWVTIECTGCAHSAPSLRFIQAGDKCPKCGRQAKVPGRARTSWLLVAGLIVVVVAFILFLYIFVTQEPKTRPLPDLPTRPIQTPI